MLAHDPQLAPDAVLVRYLALFHRFLSAVVEYTWDGDKPGILMGGYLADALHNVPSMLWYTGEDAYYTPVIMNRRMENFPEQIWERAAPERLVEDSRHILSAEGGARELGLCNDLADLHLAPLPRMRIYLNLLYRACLSMRLMINHGTRPSPVRQMVENALDTYHLFVTGKVYSGRQYPYTPWKGLEHAWTKEAQVQANANRQVAEVLLLVPHALVQWPRFDEAQFRTLVREADAVKLEQERGVWNVFLKAEQEDID